MNTVSRYLALLIFACSAAAPSWASEPRVLREEPAGVLTLEKASAAALIGNPLLESFSWELRASDARVLQSTLRPNPKLEAQMEDAAGTGQFRGTRQAQTTLLLSQMLELGGKRSARRDVATADRELKEREYELKRLEVLAQVAHAFIEVLAMQQQRALAQETTALAEATLSTVRERGHAGKAPAIEEKKALVALSRQRINEEHAEHELAVSRAKMAATWGSSTASFDRAVGALFRVDEVASFEDLAERLENGPQLSRWISKQQLSAAEARLAETRTIPNLTVGGGIRRFEGSDDSALVFGFSFPLPISNRNQGRRAESQALEQATVASTRATAVRLHTVLFGLYQELRHAAQALERLEREILPLATTVVDLAKQGFASGRLSYLELLDSHRTFVDVRRERIEVAAMYQQLLVGIERLLGGSAYIESSGSAEREDKAAASSQPIRSGIERRLAPAANSSSIAHSSGER